MKQNCILIIFLLLFMTERMFIIIDAFLFGYFLGYYSFDIFRYKNRKHETDDFFSSYNKKYGMQHRIFDLNITDDIFLENDLSYAENFLYSVIEKFEKKLKIVKFLLIYIEKT